MANELGAVRPTEPTVAQPTIRELCIGVGGFLASQALGLSDYHSMTIAVAFGIVSVILIIVPLSSSISSAAQRLRTYPLTLNFQDVVTLIGTTVGTVCAVYALTLPKPNVKPEGWQALDSKQMTAIAEVVKANPSKRVLIMRTSLPDTIPLADIFAGIFQQNGWSLLSPPYYAALQGDYFGLNILAPSTDGVANACRRQSRSS